MSSYSEALNIYFDNLSSEIKQYKNNPYHHPYGQSDCYRLGFIRFYNIIQEKYSTNYRINKTYERMYGNSKHIEPYILLKHFNNDPRDGIYVYIEFPTKPNEKWLKVSLELGKTKRYKNIGDYELNLKKLYNKIKPYIDKYKKYLSDCRNVASLTENASMLEGYIYDFSKLDNVLKVFTELYDEVIKQLNITEWGYEWEKIQRDIFTDSYISIDANSLADIDNDIKYSTKTDDNEIIKECKQMILYGAPGTGKSYAIDSCLDKLGVDKDNRFRVVFYYDYSYSDFIGYIMPRTSSNNNSELEYPFNPGPFTLALCQALLNPDKEVYLIVEEINRGNSAAIFGDIFQLLDRDSDGKSIFPITNRLIREYLNSIIPVDVFNNFKLGENEIVLPQNLNIICTMNTADQNVFTIDSAFKRRFKMRYLSIDYDKRTDRLDTLDFISKQNVFDEKHTWTEFALFINSIIDDINYECFTISEDKKLGQYFVEERDVSSKQAFCDKVIYYLKNDVFKYNDRMLKESYEKIYNDIVYENKDIFDVIS